MSDLGSLFQCVITLIENNFFPYSWLTFFLLQLVNIATMHLCVKSDSTFFINTVNATPILYNLAITIVIRSIFRMLSPAKNSVS